MAHTISQKSTTSSVGTMRLKEPVKKLQFRPDFQKIARSLSDLFLSTSTSRHRRLSKRMFELNWLHLLHRWPDPNLHKSLVSKRSLYRHRRSLLRNDSTMSHLF